MYSVGVRELKKQLSQILQRVQDEGAVVEITRYGELIARLVPAETAPPSAEEVDTMLTDIDSLAAEIGRKWKGEALAVEAVRDVRRAL